MLRFQLTYSTSCGDIESLLKNANNLTSAQCGRKLETKEKTEQKYG